MKKLFAVLLSSLTIFTYSTSALAAEQTIEITKSVEIKNSTDNAIVSPESATASTQKVYVDGKLLESTEGNVVFEDRLFLPVRELGNALGLEVGYVQEEKIVALDNGKIQLPMNYNKAVVDGSIVSIDSENSKVGTIVVNDKTYLPIRFVSEALGYNVEYKADTKEVLISTTENTVENSTSATQLSKAEAVEAYKKIYAASEQIKNATVTVDGTVDLSMNDGTNNFTIKTAVDSSIAMDIADKAALYAEQKITAEMLGETETVNQKMYYKDGYFYISQDDYKGKMALNLEDALAMSNSMTFDQYINEDVILGATVTELDNGNKSYTFNLDLSKSLDIASQFTESIELTAEDLKLLDSIEFSNTNYTFTVDSNNNIVGCNVLFDMKITYEGVVTTTSANLNMKYENVGTTTVTPLEDDLSTYEDLDAILAESTN